MRKIILLLIAAGLCSPAFAQTDGDEQTEGRPERAQRTKIPAKSGKYRDDEARPKTFVPPASIFIGYGYGQKLKGFHDPLFVGDDKSDYLASPDHDAGFELALPFVSKSKMARDLQLDDGVDYFQFGLTLKYYENSEYQKQTIPVVPGYNDTYREVILENKKNTHLGFFFGVSAQNWSIEPGLTFTMPIVYERYRIRRTRANPAGEKVEGRGFLISNIGVLPNAKLRFGREDSIHFKILALREQYNFDFDALQLAMHLPFGDYFGMEFGAGLAPVASLFLKPIIRIGMIETHLKVSLALHHYDENLEVVGIQDAAFFNLGVKASF